ncbi:MAG: ATP-binding protein [Candidatus Competibacteraceae bacterium]
MNPCSCGYLGDAERRCACGAWSRSAATGHGYRAAGDRIDLHIEVPRLAHRVLARRCAGGKQRHRASTCLRRARPADAALPASPIAPDHPRD